MNVFDLTEIFSNENLNIVVGTGICMYSNEPVRYNCWPFISISGKRLLASEATVQEFW